MEALRTLGLAHTQITELPISITDLKNLNELQVEYTHLTNPSLAIAEKGMDAIRDFFSANENNKGDKGKIDKNNWNDASQKNKTDND